MQRVFIRNTSDGRKVEVIGTYVCIDGQPVADALVEVETHPNRKNILSTLPNATHMRDARLYGGGSVGGARRPGGGGPRDHRSGRNLEAFRDALNVRDRNAGIE